MLPKLTERDEVIANINTLVDKARAEKVPVIWVQHNSDELVPDTEGWKYVPELQRQESEPLIQKRYGDSFEDTNLEAELAKRGVGRLVVTGAQTDACIRSTIHGGFTRGYDVVLAGDAHTTDDYSEYGMPPPDKVIAHMNGYWRWQDAARPHSRRHRNRQGRLQRLSGDQQLRRLDAYRDE